MSQGRLEARRCPRTWEVEAARDGRLRAKDVDSLLRHIVGCESCQRHQRRINALGAVLRDLPPVADDLLAARRMRHRLFAEADQLLLHSPDEARSRRWVFGGIVVLASAAALAMSVGLKRSAPPHPVTVTAAPASAPALQVDVEAQPGAIWHKTQVGGQVRLDLEKGEIRARVGKRRLGESLVIHLPDGEIEDLGTVLTVRVEQNRTTSVHVFEGRVRLRLAGSTALELGPGDSWAVQPQPKVEPTPSCSTAPQPTALKPLASASSNRDQRRVGPVTDTSGKQDVAIGAGTVLPLSPQQAREEDEAYLHVVELVRAHRFVEARSAAKDYLLRFPKGFRREEVLGVATSGGP